MCPFAEARWRKNQAARARTIAAVVPWSFAARKPLKARAKDGAAAAINTAKHTVGSIRRDRPGRLRMFLS